MLRKNLIKIWVLFSLIVSINRIDLGFFLFFPANLLTLDEGRKCGYAVATAFVLEDQFDSKAVVPLRIKAENVEGLGEDQHLNKLSNLHIDNYYRSF